ncbi:DNA-binding transcriptional regulator, FadR family [Allopseudospirillum japonicum]|uniref:DNA-binding transcriptional regulator, FadR family n=1 Tax=Allopseudospirillum japonicum TaxID=64971 RepID=A0A1H6QT52_9GAMM|nr:GntR family transcriptional regulator [Allopseudospirillum japonicum]SEI46968.1 DNA-binding transcriptional regulator, FadR family [Allopseudospirillum japonicum]
MKLEFRPLVTDSLPKQIAEHLRQAILEGELRAGDRLPTEDELAAQYQVSRPTIREALKRLAAQNLIRSRRGPTGGTFISRPTLEESSESLVSTTMLLASMNEFSLAEIAETRHQLTRLCMIYACQQQQQGLLEKTHLQQMRQHLQLQEDEMSDEAFCAADVAFHRALVNASGNRMLEFLMYALVEAMQPVANMVVYQFRERQHVIQCHHQMVTALEQGDEVQGKQAVDDLMDYLKARYQEAQHWRAQRG